MNDYRLPYDDSTGPEEPQQVHLPGFSRVVVIPMNTPGLDDAPGSEVGVMLLGTDANQGEEIVYLHGYLGLSPDQARALAKELLDQADWVNQPTTTRAA